MLGLRAFNIVLAGTGFPVAEIQASDFQFHGRKPKVEVQLAQVLQASVDEYTISAFGERFQVSAKASKATQHRIDAVVDAAKVFLSEYTGKRSVTAVGHNFQGDFEPKSKSGIEYMKHIAWRDDFAAALGKPESATLSLSTRFDRGDEMVGVIRLEPLAGDNSRVFYDLNFSWGAPKGPLPADIGEVLDRFPLSATEGSAIISALAGLEA